jgi:hypothetical protein
LRTITVLACSLALLSCHYAPRSHPSRRAADARLAGTWTMIAPEKDEKMDIRLYDDLNYVVSYNGDLYRAFHSDVAGLRLMSVQNLNDRERKWVFLEWKLDGDRLTIRAVRTEIVPAGERESLVKTIEANRDNPKLFGEAAVYAR